MIGKYLDGDGNLRNTPIGNRLGRDETAPAEFADPDSGPSNADEDSFAAVELDLAKAAARSCVLIGDDFTHAFGV